MTDSAIPASQKSSWTSFIKDLAKAGTSDLSSLSAPAFILSPTSIVEFPSYWGENVHAFAAIGDVAAGGDGQEEGEERMLKVLEWFLGTFTAQFTAREKATGSEKKPLNAFLGEQFIGKWSDGGGSDDIGHEAAAKGDEGETTLVAEQVSHHPPITAYLLENRTKGVSFEGTCAQKTSFTGKSITVKQVGHGLLRVALPPGSSSTTAATGATSGEGAKKEEIYLITLPKLTIEGLFFGKPYVELGGTSWIADSEGRKCFIDYSGKGYFSGKSHSFTATLTNPTSPSPRYVITGQWHLSSKYTLVPPSPSPASSSHRSRKVNDVFVDFDKVPSRPITVLPLEQQGPYESRNVWREVAEGIRSGDFAKASEAKGKIEVSERQKRKDELAAGTPHQTRLFTLLQNDPDYEKLAKLCGHKPEKEDSFKLIRR